MADTTIILNGHPVKLVDNGDGTFSFDTVTHISGRNTEDGTTETSAISITKDENGYAILRVVLGANWPYSEDSGLLNIESKNGPAIAYEALTISSTAVELTSTLYQNATRALITVETNSIRYRIDGGTPTTTVGHLVAAGGEIVLTNASDITHFKAIATAADGAIKITYFA